MRVDDSRVDDSVIDVDVSDVKVSSFVDAGVSISELVFVVDVDCVDVELSVDTDEDDVSGKSVTTEPENAPGLVGSTRFFDVCEPLLVR